jgi:hypothetical protein
MLLQNEFRISLLKRVVGRLPVFQNVIHENSSQFIENVDISGKGRIAMNLSAERTVYRFALV